MNNRTYKPLYRRGWVEINSNNPEALKLIARDMKYRFIKWIVRIAIYAILTIAGYILIPQKSHVPWVASHVFRLRDNKP